MELANGGPRCLTPRGSAVTDIDHLKRITALFESCEHDYTFGAFGRFDERMAAAALADGSLVIDDGFEYAFIRTVATQRRSVADYAGPVADVRPGTVIIRRPVAAHGERLNTPAVTALCAHIRKEIGTHPVLMEGFVEDRYTTSVIAGRLSLDYISTKVRASSELVGMWGRDIFVTHRPPIERAGIAPLSLTFDVRALRREIDAVVSTWADHYSSYNLRSSWSALALRGYGGDPAFIIKPLEMSRKWREEHPDEMGWGCEDTPLRDVFTHAEPIIDAVPGDKERIRFMRLQPGGGELARHADITDPDAGVANGRLMRIHVPIVTNEDVVFTSWSPLGSVIEHHMPEGSVYYLDTRKPHRAVNGGDAPRIHLVLDVRANKELRELVMVDADKTGQPSAGLLRS